MAASEKPDRHGYILYVPADEKKEFKSTILFSDLADDIRSELHIYAVAGTKNTLAVYRPKTGTFEIGESVVRAINYEISNRICASGDYQAELLVPNVYSRIRTLIESRATEIGDAFETRTDLLCCANGVVNLKTSELMPFDPAYMMVERTARKYDPNATCPLFLDTLEAVFDGDKKKIAYFKRLIGYAATGETSCDSIFVFVGLPNTGKSTILDAIRSALSDNGQGGYSRVIKADLNRKNNGIGDGITRARYARFLQVNN